MGYKKNSDGTYSEMERKCVDTGMGIERTIAILQGKKSVYETEVFTQSLQELRSFLESIMEVTRKRIPQYVSLQTIFAPAYSSLVTKEG